MISADPEVPFRELFPYEEKDARYFFGRDEDSRILLANLLASRAWPRLGFAQTFHRLHRLIGY